MEDSVLLSRSEFATLSPNTRCRPGVSSLGAGVANAPWELGATPD